MLRPVREAFNQALDWAAMGSSGLLLFLRSSWRQQKAPASGADEERMMGLEPTTFCMASRRSSQLSYIRAGASVPQLSWPAGLTPGEARLRASLATLSALRPSRRTS
jgi:hypothetical protein